MQKAGLTINVRIHDLRHAHASWLLVGGADLQVVKQRLGHGSLRTTEKYLYTLPDADETALDASLKCATGRRPQTEMMSAQREELPRVVEELPEEEIPEILDDMRRHLRRSRAGHRRQPDSALDRVGPLVRRPITTLHRPALSLELLPVLPQ